MNSFTRKDLPLTAAQRIIFEQAGNHVFHALQSLNIQQLAISDYNKNYLSDYQKRLYYGIETGLYVLAHALHKSKKEIHELSLVDHGGGTGLISILAVKCGFGCVIYNDIFEPSCKDAQQIAIALNLAAKHYVHGDITVLSSFLKSHKINLNVLLSRNVFEHIYDGREFLKSLTQLPSTNLVLFFATTSNPHNPAVNWYTKRLHKKAEWKGFSSRWGKASDQILPLRGVRKKIISEFDSNLNAAELEQLVLASRGLLVQNIQKLITEYRETGKINLQHDLGTNTCDPYTGNWTERLTPTDTIAEWFSQAGFKFELLNGFYDTHYQKGWKNLITTSLNTVIQPRGNPGLFFCPFIGLAGTKI